MSHTDAIDPTRIDHDRAHTAPAATDTRRRDESGQATAEYALLTGVIALVIALVAAWATSTGKVAALLDAVFDGLIRAAG